MFSFPVLSLVTPAHVRLGTSAQCMSGLHVFLNSFSGIHVALFWVYLNVTNVPGRCHFNEKWLEKDPYKSWLRKYDKNSNKAFCFARNKSIDLNVIGKSAMASHMKDEAQIIRKKSSRQWEGHENISVNRNIFLGFEIKLSLKKVLEISKRVLISPWKVLEFHESDFKAFKVLDFLLNKIENPVKTNVQESKT